ncbi:caspase family protein [Streptomyces chartreusis]|uniref:caspase family protein n=1 Tax=Streptomyces chartreusis TaxID=1969 RepID=UPI003811D893
MGLPDPLSSRAVLIGVGDYEVLEPLPAVRNNLAQLAELLKDTTVWGLPADHCAVLYNPQTSHEVLDVVHEAAALARDAFVVYFAGHGLISAQADLHLALPGSDPGRLYRAVDYGLLRHELVDTCSASSRVAILDCCYSGRALQGHMGAVPDLADQARAEGTYLMTASAETKLAWAPEGERYTAFTGELVKVLAEGIPGAGALLTMDTLFWQVRRELSAKQRPLPQQRARNAGHGIVLAHNRAVHRKDPANEGDDRGSGRHQAPAPGLQPPALVPLAVSDKAGRRQVGVLSAVAGKPLRRVSLAVLQRELAAQSVVVLRSEEPLDRRPLARGCLKTLLYLLCAYLVSAVCVEAMPVPDTWPFLGIFTSILSAGYLVTMVRRERRLRHPPNAVCIGPREIYIERLGVWIHVPWPAIRSIHPTQDGRYLELLLDSSLASRHVRIVLPRAARRTPELLPLCPYGWFGYESAELLSVLRRFAPHEILDPALRAGRPASDYPRSS